MEVEQDSNEFSNSNSTNFSSNFDAPPPRSIRRNSNPTSPLYFAANSAPSTRIEKKSSYEEQVPFYDWNIQNRYRLDKIVGGGSYGCVVKAYDMILKREVAIKRIQNVFVDLVDAQRVLREIYILRHLNNPNIVKILNVYVNDNFPINDDIYIVMEYMPFDLAKTLKSNQYWDEQPIRYIMFQLISGIEYLHRYNIIHRDLKPANLLLNTTVQLKICDFGLSRLMLDTNSINDNYMNIDSSKTTDYDNEIREARNDMIRKMTQHVYTRWYRAPELLLLRPYTEKIDVWGAGCIFAELLQMMRNNCPNYKDRKALFPGTICDLLSPDQEKDIPENERMDQLETIYKILGGSMNSYIYKVNQLNGNQYIKQFDYQVDKRDWRKIFPSCSNEGLHLLSLLLEIDPDKRPSAKECLCHPYLYPFTKQTKLNFNKTDIDFVPLPLNMNKELLTHYFIQEVLYYRRTNQA